MSILDNAQEIAPCILVIDDAIDNSKEVIDMAMKKDSSNFLNAEIFNSDSSLMVNEEIRKTIKIDIGPSFKEDVFWWELSQKIWQYGNEYGIKNNVRFSNMEEPQFLWYKANEGFFNPHSDSGTIQRVFSTVLYLNDVEEGGETYFDKFDVSVKPKSGRMIMFPGNFAYSHGAKVPLSNDKFVVVAWFHP